MAAATADRALPGDRDRAGKYRATHIQHLLKLPRSLLIPRKPINQELADTIVELDANLVPDHRDDVLGWNELMGGEGGFQRGFRHAAEGRADFWVSVGAERAQIVADGEMVVLVFGCGALGEGAFSTGWRAEHERDVRGSVLGETTLFHVEIACSLGGSESRRKLEDKAVLIYALVSSVEQPCTCWSCSETDMSRHFCSGLVVKGKQDTASLQWHKQRLVCATRTLIPMVALSGPYRP